MKYKLNSTLDYLATNEKVLTARSKGRFICIAKCKVTHTGLIRGAKKIFELKKAHYCAFLLSDSCSRR